MASLTELSFNWTGFISAMISNIAFTYRSIYLKKAMTGMDSTNVYAYTSIIALLFCLPLAIFIEGPNLMQYGFKVAIAKVGLYKFLPDLFWIGMFYHLYNQAEKTKLKEELRREKEAVRIKVANNRAAARRIAKESMDLIEDERLELMELAASSKGLPSILALDGDTLQNLDSLKVSFLRELHHLPFLFLERLPRS